MAHGDLGRLSSHLNHLLVEPDERLLTRFLETRDETSFAAIVRRHGPMVLGVCRRLLRHQQDAEDCFQATFIILALRASAVRKRTSLANWLHGVACRTAQQARCVNARRHAREKQVDEMPHPTVAASEPQDWRVVLDEELGRLPEQYRTAVLLCDLEGRPRQEAAQLLGIPEGTLYSRLATARKLLAARLSARGVTLCGTALAATLSGAAASAAVPPSLLTATSKAAVLAAAGKLAANATTAAALTHEVMKAMFLTKLKAAVAGLLVVLALGAVGLASHMTGAPAAQAADSKAPNELETLRRENELLKLNLRVTLEKLEAMETALKRQAEKTETTGREALHLARLRQVEALRFTQLMATYQPFATAELEAAIKALRDAKNEAASQKALKALDEALQKVRMQKPEAVPAPKP